MWLHKFCDLHTLQSLQASRRLNIYQSGAELIFSFDIYIYIYIFFMVIAKPNIGKVHWKFANHAEAVEQLFDGKGVHFVADLQGNVCLHRQE